MSKPFDNYSDNLQGAIREITSGISALNMQSNPIPQNEIDIDSNMFLSDTDAWVKHSLEHFDKAI